MSRYDHWLEEPYQRHFAEQERDEAEDPSEESLFRALASAQAAALSYVAACARARLVDDGTTLDTATRHARALGASHGQITTSLRVGAEEAA
jgi:hypothetical protein